MPHPLSKLLHLDFRKWRVGRTVLTKTGAELRTGLCWKCFKCGLEIPRQKATLIEQNWYIHVAIVDTLGDRLLPHKACPPRGVRGKAPVVSVPRVQIEAVEVRT